MIRAWGAMIAASALALAIAGCAAPAELTRYPKARVAPASRIEQIRAELARTRAFAGLFTRFLPLEQRRRLEALAAGVDAALAIAEATGTSAAVDQADDRLEDYRFAAGA